MTKSETKSFNEDVSGDFVGIGAEMQKKNKRYYDYKSYERFSC